MSVVIMLWLVKSEVAQCHRNVWQLLEAVPISPSFLVVPCVSR